MLRRVITLAVVISAIVMLPMESVLAKENIGTVARRLRGVGAPFVNVIVLVSYLCGLGFVLASAFKFKEHKQNPQQVPVGTAIAMFIVGILMVFLPGLVRPLAATMFGQGAPSSWK